MGSKMQLWVLASGGVWPQWWSFGVWMFVEMNLPMRKNIVKRAAAWQAVSMVERWGWWQDRLFVLDVAVGEMNGAFALSSLDGRGVDCSGRSMLFVDFVVSWLKT